MKAMDIISIAFRQMDYLFVIVSKVVPNLRKICYNKTNILCQIFEIRRVPMSLLSEIAPSVQQVAEAIAIAVGVEVEIVDDQLTIIGGTAATQQDWAEGGVWRGKRKLSLCESA